jgi:hypothetical protein
MQNTNKILIKFSYNNLINDDKVEESKIYITNEFQNNDR